ncbi:Piso0_005710 [Millerozyma farinosa CBS 7064]|uniref:Transmembrane 9 superfamily member n=1 Tax=Pichia sorbitophila (strain ATCC MYA-4447 / BCRC 22081 / CBS 7064 / NBRC 10061 / NRRL Y-12695) TaxID=559304 RepID=G8XZQ8_PICSO|nr:Piso0_005710 [Millerozyma farinosa CBS 7064]
MFIYESVIALLCLLGLCRAFYLPGVAPTDYKEGEQIPLLVNHLTPAIRHASNTGEGNLYMKTFIYSYDYYSRRFHFCQPEGGPVKQSESLGSIIFGDRIFNSPFKINMLENKTCETLCVSTYSKSDGVFVNRNIRADYYHNWIIDGLPAAHTTYEVSTKDQFLGTGFPIGEVDDQHEAHLFNHFDIEIDYHKRDEHRYRVVGVTVKPASLDRNGLDLENDKDKICSPELKKITLNRDDETKVLFSYSVYFKPSNTVWATRWDKYLHVYDPRIQWFSLINFSIIVIVLAIIIAHILLRTLKNDIMKYNEVNLDDDISDESGWKLIHGDVFRPPKNKMLLSVLLGSGVQIFLMSMVTIIFALFGLLSPSNRGALSTFMFIIYILFGIASSFVSGYSYRLFGGENWKLNLVLTPTVVPSVLFAIFIFLNFFLIYVESSGAIPIGTMFAIIALWFLVSLPLSVIGSILAAKRPLLSIPVRTNQIPRQIPSQPWYLRAFPAMIISGIFPFGSIAVEMYFIYSSLWFNRIFYMFGFLFFCFVLMILTTGLISVLMIYYTLCSENYKWQWKSYFIGGGCAIYIFLHSLLLAGSYKLTGVTSIVLYVGYSVVASLLVFVNCGTIGFITSFFFVRKIYSQIKID